MQPQPACPERRSITWRDGHHSSSGELIIRAPPSATASGPPWRSPPPAGRKSCWLGAGGQRPAQIAAALGAPPRRSGMRSGRSRRRRLPGPGSRPEDHPPGLADRGTSKRLLLHQSPGRSGRPPACGPWGRSLRCHAKGWTARVLSAEAVRKTSRCGWASAEAGQHRLTSPDPDYAQQEKGPGPAPGPPGSRLGLEVPGRRCGVGWPSLDLSAWTAGDLLRLALPAEGKGDGSAVPWRATVFPLYTGDDAPVRGRATGRPGDRGLGRCAGRWRPRSGCSSWFGDNAADCRLAGGCLADRPGTRRVRASGGCRIRVWPADQGPVAEPDRAEVEARQAGDRGARAEALSMRSAAGPPIPWLPAH